MNLGQIVKWILKHKRGNAFTGYSTTRIINELDECIDNNTISIVTSGDDIVGLLCFKKVEKTKRLFVYDVLTTKAGALRGLIRLTLHNYPGFTFEGHRRNGRYVHFINTQRLLTLIK